MSAKAARHASRSRPARTWMLVAAAAAYLALALHAGLADALAPNGPASVPAVPASGFASGFHDSIPAPSDPCCIQHACDTLAAVGPIVPGTRERLRNAPDPSAAIVDRRAASVAARPCAQSDPPPARSVAIGRSLYLTTARIRL